MLQKNLIGKTIKNYSITDDLMIIEFENKTTLTISLDSYFPNIEDLLVRLDVKYEKLKR